jgi:hypothetical protein
LSWKEWKSSIIPSDKDLLKIYMPLYCRGCRAYLGLVKRENYQVEAAELRMKLGGKCPNDKCGRELTEAKKFNFFRWVLRKN